MKIITTRPYTDRETKEKIKAGKELTVKYERGLTLIKGGNARLVSYDDDTTIDITELEKAIAEKDSIIAEMGSHITELEKAIAALQKPKK